VSDEDAAALVVEGLRIETSAGVEIVDDIAFQAIGGEVFGLVGESGCGKTSIALALLGHARPGTRIATGSVVIGGGGNLLSLKESERRALRGSLVSYVPQDPPANLNPRQRVGAQIAETLRVHGVDRSTADAAVSGLVGRVGLSNTPSFLRRYPFELSGGQQQRVAIAIALIGRPRVIVLDEPTTGLDVTTQARVLELLRELARDTATAFIYVTHDLAVVDELADRVGVMYAGRLVEVGERASLFARPAHPYTVLLLGSVPRVALRHRLTGISGTAPPPGSRPRGCSFALRCPLATDVCDERFPARTTTAHGGYVRCYHTARTDSIGSVLEPAPPPLVVDPNQSSLLAVDALVAAYGRGPQRSEVVHRVSFSVAAREGVGLVGESGSGKTTIGRCLVGLHVAESGTIRLNGEPLPLSVHDRTRAQRQAIQIVFQNPDRSLNPNETVAQAISRPLRLLRGRTAGGMRARVAELADRVRLASVKLDQYPRELSGGEKQRVAVARALASDPLLLVCDEITSALDVSIQAAIVDLLGELRDQGLALLFITHNLALVNSTADRVIVLEAGDVREEGMTTAVLGAPSHPYTRALIEAAPDLETVTAEPGLRG
jgi:peptide/nickel transport system ATP-binding protein